MGRELLTPSGERVNANKRIDDNEILRDLVGCIDDGRTLVANNRVISAMDPVIVEFDERPEFSVFGDLLIISIDGVTYHAKLNDGKLYDHVLRLAVSPD